MKLVRVAFYFTPHLPTPEDRRLTSSSSGRDIRSTLLRCCVQNQEIQSSRDRQRSQIVLFLVPIPVPILLAFRQTAWRACAESNGDRPSRVKGLLICHLPTAWIWAIFKEVRGKTIRYRLLSQRNVLLFWRTLSTGGYKTRPMNIISPAATSPHLLRKLDYRLFDSSWDQWDVS